MMIINDKLETILAVWSISRYCPSICLEGQRTGKSQHEAGYCKENVT